MLTISTVFASLQAFSTVTVAIPARRADDPGPNSGIDPKGILGYGTVPISWDLPTDLNNPSAGTITVTGTVQEAVAAMEAAYPGWNGTFQSKLPASTAEQQEDGDDTSDLGLFSFPTRESFTCDLPYVQASKRMIWDGIRYLRTLSGSAKNGPGSPGKGNCGRVSCSWSAAIWWCNDVGFVVCDVDLWKITNNDETQNNFEKEVGWNDIADGAEFLCRSDCVHRKKDVLGQVFYTDKWNVIARHDQNNC
ncbi:uncharacterized protein PODANS_5_9850 [Podospora anserina S mat+]|uniref:Podospora anserina S mat+ genomic DNA chromosome 5, supercontig 9 n=1 Tax=Podospora anserina (strain S / ATCC MYA-4624 / DSM 980 / FGSC 10383) TaxID=515849 RepID=B2AL76_PODAN|nr:uncharacterized protein PODANS_5_9850 [Podospora anserina S mat+]CAP64714.1 unnamed protein product [Podospora anserina S mat+]CDP30111.1 Putative protein of unknown function [Podospora anserina S mat+]